MIELNLQLFAKTASQMGQYRKSQAIKKYNMPGLDNNAVNEQSVDRRRAPAFKEGRINRDSDISKNETYNIFRVRNKDDEHEIFSKEMAGSDLRDTISYERLKYDRRLGVWVSRKGNRYVIRKKK